MILVRRVLKWKNIRCDFSKDLGRDCQRFAFARQHFEKAQPLTFTVHEASEQDADRAVAAAKAAQPAWAALSIEERAKPFKKLAALIREHNDELAELEALSMGSPVSSYFHAYACAHYFDYFAEAGYNNQGTSSLNTPGFVNLTFRQPFGVVAAIIPWNVPLLFFAQKVAPALMAGNTVVLKSSEKAPLTARLFLISLWFTC